MENIRDIFCAQRRRSEGTRNGSGAQNGTDSSSSSDEEREAAECEDDDETVEVRLAPALSQCLF